MGRTLCQPPLLVHYAAWVRRRMRLYNTVSGALLGRLCSLECVPPLFFERLPA